MYLHNNHHQQQQRYYKPDNTSVFDKNNRSIFRKYDHNLNQQQQPQTLAPIHDQFSYGHNNYQTHHHPNEISPPTNPRTNFKHFHPDPTMKDSNDYYDECGLCMPNLSTRPTYDENNNNKNQINSLPKGDDRSNYMPVVNPPSWCSPAKGESRLEPIGMTKEAHKSIDLTKKPYYRIGRSPYSTIPLYHTTSSRNHAILYHHPKTNICYVIDNYSIHGTYVDGKRIKPGKEIRIRRSAIVRFGSFGCPSFILKSFNVTINDLMINLGCVMDSLLNKVEDKSANLITTESSSSSNDYNEESNDKNDKEKSNDIEDDEKQASKGNNNNVQEYFKHAQHWVQQQSSSRRSKIILKSKVSSTSKESSSSNSSDDVLTCIRGDGGGVACISNEKEIPYASLTLIHTRLNAIGCSNINGVLDKQNQVQEDNEYYNHNVSRNNYTKQDIDMINGYEKFVSLSQLYSFSDDNKYDMKHLSSSLVGKKRKRGDKSTTSSPPSSPTTNNATLSSLKYKSILHSVSMDEDCITPNTNKNQYYRSPQDNYVLPRRRKIRFEDEINQKQEDDCLYSYPQVSFELYDSNNNTSYDGCDNKNYKCPYPHSSGR